MTNPNNTLDDPFGDPASGDFLNGDALKRLKGSLWLIQVLGYETHVPTKHSKPGEMSPAVKATVHVLTNSESGEGQGEKYENTLIFGKAMIPKLQPMVGKMILARLGQGENKKGNPPWELNKASDDDKTLARKWLAENPLDPFANA